MDVSFITTTGAGKLYGNTAISSLTVERPLHAADQKRNHSQNNQLPFVTYSITQIYSPKSDTFHFSLNELIFFNTTTKQINLQQFIYARDYPFCWILPQVSLRVSVRLNTSLPAAVSESVQK